MVVASVTLLPAFLGLAGHRINRLGVRRSRAPRRRRGGLAAGGAGASTCPGTRWAYAIGVTVLLLALAAPVLALRVGIPDEGTLPETRTERRAYDLVADGLRARQQRPAGRSPSTSREDPSVVEPLRRRRRRRRGHRRGRARRGGRRRPASRRWSAFPTTGPQDEATRDTIERLRADVLPPALAGSPARAHIGGQTASFADVGDRVNDRLPLFIAAVVLLSFLLLMRGLPVDRSCRSRRRC